MEKPDGDAVQRMYTLREAAVVCDVKVDAIRSRADRGTLRTIRRDDGQRLVPHAELERLKLLPGAEERSLRGEVERLRGELMVHRQLVEDTARAREHAEQELREVQQQHGAMVAELAHVRCERDGARGALRDLDDQLAGAGVIKAWKLARARRKGAAEVSPSQERESNA